MTGPAQKTALACRHRTAQPSVAGLFLLLFCLYRLGTGLPAVAQNSSRISRRENVVAFNLLVNSRTGYFQILDTRQDTVLPRITLLGGALGRLYYLGPRFVLGFGAELHMGSIDTDTLAAMPLSDGSVHDLAYVQEYRQAGCIGDIRYVLPAEHIFAPFFLVGTGLHYMRLSKIARVIDGDSWYRRPVELDLAANGWHISISIRAGAGIRAILTPRVALHTFYEFRYWQPVSYEYVRDLPLSPVEYRETFRTHSLRMGLSWLLVDE